MHIGSIIVATKKRISFFSSFFLVLFFSIASSLARLGSLGDLFSNYYYHYYHVHQLDSNSTIHHIDVGQRERHVSL